MSDDELKYHTDAYRWIALILFCSLSMCNSFFWVTFAPISDITQAYIGGDGTYNNITAINMLANIFLVFYLPGTIFTNILRKQYGLRKTFLICGLLTLLGSLCRFIPTLFYPKLSSGFIYMSLLLGQFIASIVQPFFCNIPPGFSNVWFPAAERDIATAVGSVATTTGNAMGLLFSVYFVSHDSSSSSSTSSITSISSSSSSSSSSVNVPLTIVQGMSTLLGAETVIIAIVLALFYFFFRSSPLHPPSAAAAAKHQLLSHDNKYTNYSSTVTTVTDTNLSDVTYNKHNRVNCNGPTVYNQHPYPVVTSVTDNTTTSMIELPVITKSSSSSPLLSSDNSKQSIIILPNTLTPKKPIIIIQTKLNMSIQLFMSEISELLKNRNYILLLFIYMISNGLLCALQILLFQLIQPFDYSNNDAGVLGSVLIASGVGGAALASVIMTCLKNYNSIFKIFQTCAMINIIFFILMLQPHNYQLLFLSIITLGCFLCPLTLINMELCAEITFPIAEDVSFGMLAIGGNIMGFLLVIVLQQLQALKPIDLKINMSLFHGSISSSSSLSFSIPPSSLFIICIFLIITILSYFFQGVYKRSQVTSDANFLLSSDSDTHVVSSYNSIINNRDDDDDDDDDNGHIESSILKNNSNKSNHYNMKLSPHHYHQHYNFNPSFVAVTNTSDDNDP